MKKLTTTALLLAGLVTTQVMAEDSGFYAGFELGQSNGKATTKHNEYYKPDSHSKNGIAIGIKGGYNIDGNQRVYGLLQKTTLTGGMMMFATGYNYMFDVPISKLKPFAGAIIGQGDWTGVKGLVYGVEGGASYNIDEHIPLSKGSVFVEGGIRILKTTMEKKEATTEDYVGYTDSVDSIMTLYVSAVYKF